MSVASYGAVLEMTSRWRETFVEDERSNTSTSPYSSTAPVPSMEKDEKQKAGEPATERTKALRLEQPPASLPTEKVRHVTCLLC